MILAMGVQQDYIKVNNIYFKAQAVEAVRGKEDG